jgi:hypothetical protein
MGAEKSLEKSGYYYQTLRHYLPTVGFEKGVFFYFCQIWCQKAVQELVKELCTYWGTFSSSKPDPEITFQVTGTVLVRNIDIFETLEVLAN